MPERRRVSVYVQHLLGIGHLARAFRIADALVEADWEVELLIGGELPTGFRTTRARLVLLPPVRAPAGGLGTLVHPDGQLFDPAAQGVRRDQLLAHVDRLRPDVLIVEAFPFGRRQMRFELLPLLEHVRTWTQRPLVVSSVRDILQANRRPERDKETLATLARLFDRVYVHGDPALTRFEDSFPPAVVLGATIRYTGLVAPGLPASDVDAAFAVVVSAGGGAVGDRLLQVAIAARPLSTVAAEPWLVLTGPNLSAAAFEGLQKRAMPGLRVARLVPDLAVVLAGARLSISQAGYNTVADVLRAGCRAVFVPYAEAGETEQSTRAALLARAGRAIPVAEADLTPTSLAAAIDQALAAHRPETALRLDGAAETARLLAEDLARLRRRQG